MEIKASQQNVLIPCDENIKYTNCYHWKLTGQNEGGDLKQEGVT